MPRYFSCLTLFALVIGNSNCNDARLNDAFREVGTFHRPNMHSLYPGVTHFVVAPESVMRNRNAVLTYGRRTCAGEEVCVVLFWTDHSRAASGFPISDLEAGAMVASYARSRITGADHFQCYNFGSPAEHCARR